MGVWANRVRIFNAIREHGKQSIRRLAERTGRSKSSVHRHTQAMARRDRPPESWLWETEAGRHWLSRLAVATLFLFGLQRGVGAETLREFFRRLPLEAHVGGSPSALRSVRHTLEHTSVETAAAWEREGGAQGERRPSIGAVDDTFLPRLRLVFMDLASGALLREEVAVERTDDPWDGLVTARRKPLAVGVLSLVSDRAKALINLAHTGLGCLSIPALLHRSPALAKSYARAICSRLRHAPQALPQARERLATLQASHPDSAQAQQAQALVETSAVEVQRWQGVGSAYRHGLGTLSLRMHPWRLVDSTRPPSQEGERQWHAEVEALEAFVETNGLPVKQHALDKVRQQLAGVAALVDLWWQTVWHDVEPMVLPLRGKPWGDEWLRPLMYGSEQRSPTRCPRQKAEVLQALRAVQDALERQPCTQRRGPEVLAAWKAWAAEHARAFPRASSAVEGRNGSLSQMQPNHRGLPQRRDKVWTVLHTCDGRASDGTTPASRFFRRDVPDLFETVLSQIEELPRPRRRNQAIALSD